MYIETCPVCYCCSSNHYEDHRGTDKYGRYISYMCKNCYSMFKVHVETRKQPKARPHERDKYRDLTSNKVCRKEHMW